MNNAITSAIAEPYSEALMSIAKDSNIVDAIASDVAMTLEILKESEEFSSLIVNPIVNADLKQSVISQVVDGRVQDVYKKFLMLLIDRRRIYLLEAICNHFQAMVRELQNTVLAEVTSTMELNDSQKETVKQKVISMTGANSVELETKIDADLLGGVIIKIGSQVLDASIRGQLRRISASLTSAS